MRSRPGVHRACAWAAPAGLVLTFGGMLAAGWLPPPVPGDGPTEVATYYRVHADAIRLASILIFVGGVLLLPLAAVTSVYLDCIEGGRGPLGYLQLISGALGPVAFVVPCILWAGAAYTPGRAPEITQALHDTAWLSFIAGIWTFALQNVAIGTAILGDQRDEPVLPRWLGYLALWAAVLFAPSCLVLFFHDGPFAWNGVFTFWLAAVAFVVWTVALVLQLQRAIGRFAGQVPAAAA